MDDRNELRTTFESAADRYHEARPRYPAEMFERLAELCGLGPGASILEVGPASGIATEPLAATGAHVTAVELGAQLAATARARLAHRPNVTIVEASFESWQPPAWGAFDAVVAATAWHWVDPAAKYELAHQHLRPGGSLAFWSATHVVPEGGDTFFAEIQDVYDEIGESLPTDHHFLRPDELPDSAAEIAGSGLFEVTAIERFDWETVYDADGYLALLDTFSGHIAMERWKWDRLAGEIRRRLSERDDGLLRRHWGAVLHVARAVAA